MNYTLNQLRVYVKVFEKQSVTKASEALHMTQPAVSIQLKNFQDQFKIPLFEVISRQVHFTAFGVEVVESAMEILRQANLLKEKAIAFDGNLSGTLKVSVVSTGKYVMPFFLKGFLEQHPGVDLQMDVTNKNLVIESLLRNEVDFALVSIIPKKLTVDSIPLLKNSLYLIGGNPMGSKRKWAMRELMDRPLILREEGSGTRQMMEKYMKKDQVLLTRKLELTSNEAVKQAVKAGLGYSIMPLIGLKNELESGELSIQPIRGLPMHSEWQLISLRGKRHGPVAKAYKAYLQENKSFIIERYFGWLSEYSTLLQS